MAGGHIKKVKAGELAGGLDVHFTANDATSKTDTLTSIDTFDTNVLGVYDTQTDTYVDLSEQELSDPKVIEKYTQDPNRYSVAMGSEGANIEDADGFMNMDDFVKTIDFGLPEKQTGTNMNPTDKSNEKITNIKDLNVDVTGMTPGQSKKMNINGENVIVTPYEDGTAVVEANNPDGSKEWRRYADDGQGNKNLIEIRFRPNGSTEDVVQTYVDGKPISSEIPSAVNGPIKKLAEEGNLTQTDQNSNNNSSVTNPTEQITTISNEPSSTEDQNNNSSSNDSFNGPQTIASKGSGTINTLTGEVRNNNARELRIADDGKKATLTSYSDGSKVVGVVGKDKSQEWFRYDNNNNLTEVRQRTSGSTHDVVRTFSGGKEIRAQIVSNGQAASATQVANISATNTATQPLQQQATGMGTYSTPSNTIKAVKSSSISSIPSGPGNYQ